MSLFFLLAPNVHAHMVQSVVGTITIEPTGRFSCQIDFDAVSFALNTLSQNVMDDDMRAILNGPPATLDARLAESKTRFAKSFAIICDGRNATIDTLTFPTAAALKRRWEVDAPLALPVIGKLEMHGHLPARARSLSFTFPAELGPVVLTVFRPGEEPGALVADPGEPTDPITVHLSTSATTTASSAPAPTAPYFPPPPPAAVTVPKRLIVAALLLLGTTAATVWVIIRRRRIEARVKP